MNYIIPVILILIVFSGILKKIPVYSVFCDGALEGMKTVMGIFPVIMAITMGVSMLKASGVMGYITGLLENLLRPIGFPTEVLPLVLVRPLSGGGAMGILTDILNEFHPDSFIGFFASVIMGSTETTFYTLMVYLKNTRVKYSKHIIPAAVFGDIVGVIVGLACSTIFF